MADLIGFLSNSRLWRAGLIQLFCMSTCLWTFGRYLERVLLVPILAVPAVYMVSGIAGGLASANLAVDRVNVTSSAAICGLIGWFAFLLCSIELPLCVASWACCIPHCAAVLRLSVRRSHESFALLL